MAVARGGAGPLCLCLYLFDCVSVCVSESASVSLSAAEVAVARGGAGPRHGRHCRRRHQLPRRPPPMTTFSLSPPPPPPSAPARRRLPSPCPAGSGCAAAGRSSAAVAPGRAVDRFRRPQGPVTLCADHVAHVSRDREVQGHHVRCIVCRVFFRMGKHKVFCLGSFFGSQHGTSETLRRAWSTDRQC